MQQYWHNLPGYHQIYNIQLHYLDGELEIDIYLPMIKEYSLADLTQQYQQAITEMDHIRDIKIYVG